MDSRKLDNHYNWALIEGSNIKLFNESTLNFSAFSTDAFEDVSVEIDDKGVLYIEAKKRLFISLHQLDSGKMNGKKNQIQN